MHSHQRDAGQTSTTVRYAAAHSLILMNEEECQTSSKYIWNPHLKLWINIKKKPLFSGLFAIEVVIVV
jgi:hypothetical protein